MELKLSFLIAFLFLNGVLCFGESESSPAPEPQSQCLSFLTSSESSGSLIKRIDAELNPPKNLFVPTPEGKVVYFAVRTPKKAAEWCAGRVLDVLTEPDGSQSIWFYQILNSIYIRSGNVKIPVQDIILDSFQDEVIRGRLIQIIQDAIHFDLGIRYFDYVTHKQLEGKVEGFIWDEFGKPSGFILHDGSNRIGGIRQTFNLKKINSIEAFPIQPRLLNDDEKEILAWLRQAQEKKLYIGLLERESPNSQLRLRVGFISKPMELGVDGEYRVYLDSPDFVFPKPRWIKIKDIVASSLRARRKLSYNHEDFAKAFQTLQEAQKTKSKLVLKLLGPAQIFMDHRIREGNVESLEVFPSSEKVLFLKLDSGKIESIPLSHIIPEFLYLIPQDSPIE